MSESVEKNNGIADSTGTPNGQPGKIKILLTQTPTNSGAIHQPIKTRKDPGTTIQEIMSVLRPQLALQEQEAIYVFLSKYQVIPPPNTTIGDLFALYAENDILRLEYSSQLAYG